MADNHLSDPPKHDDEYDREKAVGTGTDAVDHYGDPGIHRREDAVQANPLARKLKGRHMQMIAIGGSIGAGLFVGSGQALYQGGPGSLLIGFLIVGAMLLTVMQALGELAVVYPVNGAFYQYFIRFIDPSWGFALGWDYAIQWLTVLPFELTAAGFTIRFWRPDLNIGIWVAVFFVALVLIQLFGVRGYGEVEFILGVIKILACTGFILFAIIDDCGGVPTDSRGYIGAHYWHQPGAFAHGFKGFCSVFVTAAFAYGGTELAGLAAAEAEDPAKSLPKACRQVFWRISFFYIVNLFLVGLIVPADSPFLLGSSGANTKASPFVVALQNAGVKGLPSVFNAVITIAVLSVANSATFGSTRTFQALAAQGMAPKVLAYVDHAGRPVASIILQLAFALLAFINEDSNVGTQFFNWLLALSGLSSFFTWGSICWAHLRFRRAWHHNNRSIDELPYVALFGVYGSMFGLLLSTLCIIATFYVALYPVGGKPDASAFFQGYLAAPLIFVLWAGWKIYSATSKDPKVNYRGWKLFLRKHEIDIWSGIRDNVLLSEEEVAEKRAARDKMTLKDHVIEIPKSFISSLFY